LFQVGAASARARRPFRYRDSLSCLRWARGPELHKGPRIRSVNCWRQPTTPSVWPAVMPVRSVTTTYTRWGAVPRPRTTASPAVPGMSSVRR